MGFIAKSQTKKRVAPVSGPVNEALAGTPWLTTGAIPTGALIRSSVFTLDLTNVGLHSGKSALTRKSPGQLWVETEDLRHWDFVLGVGNGANGVTADWLVELVVRDDGSAVVGTSQWRTKDGALLHADEHDALRTELLRAIALGRLADETAEARLTTKSLSVEQRFEAQAPAPRQATFRYSTALEPAAIAERLELVGFPVTSSASESVTWGLGLPAQSACDYASANVGPGSVAVDATVGSESETARRMAHADLRYLVARILRCLRSRDDTAEFHGPEELAP